MTSPPRVSRLMIRRFLQLPRSNRETWQGAIVAMPAWIKSAPDAEPVRPHAAVWVSLNTGLMHAEMEREAGGHGPELALEAFVQFGLKRYKGSAGRPACIQLADPDLGSYIVAEVGDPELAVDIVAEPLAVREVVRRFAQGMAAGPLPPGPFSGEGVTLHHLGAFADAAADYWRSEPWQWLTDEDTIRVEAPEPPPSMAYVTVLGNAGISYGINFRGAPIDLLAIERQLAGGSPEGVSPFWSVFYGRIDEMPYEDADLFLEQGLPVADRHAYPWLVRIGPGETMNRASRRELVFAEGVMRALAVATEDQIDTGRWTSRVETAEGPTVVTLALPLLLPGERDQPRWRAATADARAMERVFVELERHQREHPAASPTEREEQLVEFIRGLEAHERPATARMPIEQAEDLVFDAFDARGRRRVVLARQALALDPDAADAHTLLAEQAAGPARALPHYARAVEAGRRRLGAEIFEQEKGSFWEIVSTRPYMRALLGKADTLVSLGEPEQALPLYRELLALNPDDRQGARYRLFRLYLEARRDDDADALVELYADDASAEWAYGRALLAFRREGDTPAARRTLQAAIRANRHVPRMMADQRSSGEVAAATVGPGSDEEASLCIERQHRAWLATPGAVAWLQRVSAASRTGRGSPSRRRPGGRRPPR